MVFDTDKSGLDKIFDFGHRPNVVRGKSLNHVELMFGSWQSDQLVWGDAMLARWWIGGVGVLAAFMVPGVQAQDRDTYQSVRGTNGLRKGTIAKSIDDSWWPFGRSEIAEPSLTNKEKSTSTTSTQSLTNPTTVQTKDNSSPNVGRSDLAVKLKQELQTYLRRQEVCDRLKQIAEETGDTALEQQAELMAQRAWFVYQQKTSAMRLPGLLPTSEQQAADALLSKKNNESVNVAEAPIRSIRANHQRDLMRDGKE